MAQLGSLIVTGTSRFLNKIYGTCTDGTNGTTKYLRQDGTWQVPPNDNTDTKVTQTNLSPTASTYYTIPFSKTCNTTEETDSLYKVQDLQVAFDGPDRLASIKLSNSATSSYKFSQYAAGSMALYQSTSSSDPPTAFMAITPNDITVTSYAQGTNNTWDGTNSSLKTAVSNARTTVTQTATTTSANYEILFSGTADDTTRTEVARKTSTFTYNPNKMSFLVGTLKSGTTLGDNAIVFGTNIQASAKYSYAEGYGHVVSGFGSHAEGENNTVDGRCAHAEGSSTTANGWHSHSEGDGTIAKFKSQHVFGDFNIEDPSTSTASGRGNYVEIVGNGTTNNARSNARTLDWYGNEWLAGNLTLSGTASDITLSGTGNTWDGTNTSLKTAVTELVSANYLKKSGGTMTGFIKLGTSSQTTLPTAGLRVHDVRSVAITTSCVEQGVNFFLTNESSSTPYTNSSPWASILHIKGWKDNYKVWELAGPAMTGTSTTVPLYVRVSNGTTWGSWRQIYDSSNPPPTTSESSIKVKKNISAISDEEVNSILKLNAVKFDFKSSEENNAIHRGFIAEDVAKILPNLVTDEVVDGDGNLVDPARLNYMEMIPYLVEVCKRQQKEIDGLKSLIRK